MNIVQFTRADADIVAGRPITDSEYRRLVKTAEWLFPEIFIEMVETLDLEESI